MDRPKAVAYLAFLVVIFQHFQLANLGGYPLTLGFLLGVPLVGALFPKRPTTPILIGGFATLGLAAGPAMLESRFTDSAQFTRTLVLFAIAATYVALSFLGEPKVARRMLGINDLQYPLRRSLTFALAIVVGLSTLQAVAGAAGSEQFFNVFGSHQYLYEYKPNLQFVTVPRAQGFYLEPSYNAFVIGTVTVILLSLRARPLLVAGLCLTGMIVTQSATGLSLLLILLFFHGLVLGGRQVVFAASAVVVLKWTIGAYLSTRLDSIGTSGSSANYRLKAPLALLENVLTSHPLGFPMGSLSTVVQSQGLANGTTVGASLDNGFYVLIFYFGWAGLAICIAMIALAIRAAFRSIRTHKHSPGDMSYVAPLWVVGTMFFSGGIMLPEFATMTFLCLRLHRLRQLQSLEPEVSDPNEPDSQHRDRDLPRSGRPGHHAGVSGRLALAGRR